jgi:hypothetical protein
MKMGKPIDKLDWAKGALRLRAGAGALAVFCAALLAAPVHADPQSGQGERRDEGQSNSSQQQQRSPRNFRDPRWGDERDPRSFEARAEEQRRMMQENANNAEINRRMSRMSPDERRDLRRQINEMGAEVYSNQPAAPRR